MLSGYFERDGFVFKGTLQYLTDVLLFHLQCDAVRELYFFPIDEGESGCIFQLLHELSKVALRIFRFIRVSLFCACAWSEALKRTTHIRSTVLMRWCEQIVELVIVS